MSSKVIPIQPATEDGVAAIIDSMPTRGFTKLLTVGQTPDGYWNIQFGGCNGEVEILGVLEMMKMEIWQSMTGADDEQ